MAETVSMHSGAKETRTNSLGRAKSDCHTCSRTRQACDRQRPRCGTCNNIGLICGGYSLDLTWKTIKSGVKSPKPFPTPKSPNINNGNTARPPTGEQVVPSPGRQFKFKVGKPKRPRKRPQEAKSPCEGATLLGCTTNTASSHDPAFLRRHASSQSPECTTQSSNSTAPSEVSAYDINCRGRALDDLSDTTYEEDVEDCDLAEGSPQTTATTMSLKDFQSSPRSGIPPMILFSSVAQKFGPVLQMYDQEFCKRPLTKDCALNPFRCEDTSQSTNFLFHAILALSSHHLSKVSTTKNLELETETFNHKSTAIRLYREALSQADTQHSVLLDALLVLITLEAAQSALSTWSVHIIGAYNLIKASGGVSVITTPRLIAQVMMLNWWDLTIAMIARHNPVFEEAYLEIIFSRNEEDSQTFFNLTGCPAEFATIMAKLSRQAATFENLQRFDWMQFDYSPVDELENRLKLWRNPFDFLSDKADNQEDPQSTRDCFHCVEAWRYALLLYALQIFRRGKEPEPHSSSNAYLCRLILDHTRCIRRSSPVQKQVLLPIFLAGAEAIDGSTHREVREYCSFWAITNGYNMFQNVGDLLERVWSDRKQYGEQQYWWGWTVDRHAKTAYGGMKTQYLLG